MSDPSITVNSRKFDGSISRTWHCQPVEITTDSVVLVGQFEKDVVHPDLGTISAGTISYEFFWPRRWYNVFRFHQPDGSIRNYYFNISMPYSFESGQLDFIDMDIDVIVWPDGTLQVVDLDEFEKNKVKYQFPENVVATAKQTLGEITRSIRDGVHPFKQVQSSHLPIRT